MPLILNIDTASENASICLSHGQQIIAEGVNNEQKDHSAWLHPAIWELMSSNQRALTDLSAVAVTIGPGSYTGLRIGLSTAKGICYALNIPLITVGTLEVMAYAVKDQASDLICPLIDARRMEVYMAIFDIHMTEIHPPRALVISSEEIGKFFPDRSILFCGSGMAKIQPVISRLNAKFSKQLSTASDLAGLAIERFEKKIFADLAYTEPFYIKEFYMPQRKLN